MPVRGFMRSVPAGHAQTRQSHLKDGPDPMCPETFVFDNEGILTSTYKEETCDNFFNSNPESVYGTKQRIKSWQYGITSSIDTILKLSVFVIALGIALA